MCYGLRQIATHPTLNKVLKQLFYPQLSNASVLAWFIESMLLQSVLLLCVQLHSDTPQATWPSLRFYSFTRTHFAATPQQAAPYFRQPASCFNAQSKTHAKTPAFHQTPTQPPFEKEKVLKTNYRFYFFISGINKTFCKHKPPTPLQCQALQVLQIKFSLILILLFQSVKFLFVKNIAIQQAHCFFVA